MKDNQVSSLLPLQASESQTLSCADAELYLTDITIESLVDNPGYSDSTMMSVDVLSSDRQREVLLFERMSLLVWKYNGSIALTDEVTLIAKVDEVDYFATLHLVKTEFDKSKDGEDLNYRITREFVTEGPTLRLVFRLASMPPEENTGQQVDGVLSYEKLVEALSHNTEMAFARVLEISDNVPQKPHLLNLIGEALLERFDSTKDVNDLDNSVLAYDLATQILPVDNENFLDFLLDSGFAILERYKLTGNLADINKAISKFEIVVKRTPDGHEPKRGWLTNLGNLFLRRFEHTGDLADIASAISYQQKAIRLTPEGHTNMPILLNNLGNAFLGRFQHAGDLPDISNAILFLQKSIQLTPKGQPDLPARLNNLGNSFLCRFKRTGDLADISEAISFQQRAIHLTPEHDADLPSWLNNLVTSLLRRFDRTRDLSDISEAMSSQQKAVKLTPEGHPDMPSRLNTIGHVFLCRYEHTKDLGDISESISSQEKAVRLTPKGHADMPCRINSLANSYLRRFECTGDFADIHEAMSYQEAAIQLTPVGHSDKPAWLSNLGNSYLCRFNGTGDLADILEAISSRKKAVDLTPEGHAHMPGRLNKLGNAFQRCFEHTGDPADNFSAISNYKKSATYISGPPSIRLEGAKQWARCSQISDPSQLLEAYRVVIDLLSQVAGLEQTIQKRYTNLINISELSASAAAAAFSFSQHGLALEWLEQGRCLVWNQLNDLRTSLDDLLLYDPILAKDVLRVSTALENAGSRAETGSFFAETGIIAKMSIQDEATAHIKLAQEWEQLLINVRAIPQFNDFLRPATCSTLLKHLPDSGFVVVINIHKDRSDALALVSGVVKPLHIPLHEFPFEKANDLRNTLKTHLLDSHRLMRGSELVTRGMRYETNENVVKGVLCQLWNLVVKPIVTGLGLSESGSLSSLSRIWWCVTGPLAFLPIHAAGIYGSRESTPGIYCTLSDFAVSSYIPTVRALVDRVRNRREITGNKRGLFMVSQPATPGMARIPGTTHEIQALEQLLKSRNFQHLCLESRAATVNQVKANMGAYSCVHFACHAAQNANEPLQSGFYLHDGRLDLLSIIKERLIGADLAFLSACQTSTGDEKLSEEAVHLAAGMLAAGYRGVVATMWSIQDCYGPKVAKDFYEFLVSHGAGGEAGSEGLSGDGAARALHYATQQIQKTLGDSEESLLTWVPYVHFGL